MSVKFIINTSLDDLEHNYSTLNSKDDFNTIYCHFVFEGGYPGQNFGLSCKRYYMHDVKDNVNKPYYVFDRREDYPTSVNVTTGEWGCFKADANNIRISGVKINNVKFTILGAVEREIVVNMIDTW